MRDTKDTNEDTQSFIDALRKRCGRGSTGHPEDKDELKTVLEDRDFERKTMESVDE